MGNNSVIIHITVRKGGVYLINKAKEVVMKFIKSIKPAAKNMVKKSESYLKEAVKTAKLLNGNLTEKIKKLNIRENLFKISEIIKKFAKAIINYNYKNTGKDLKNLAVYIKNTTINKVGSEKNVSFVSKIGYDFTGNGRVNIVSLTDIYITQFALFITPITSIPRGNIYLKSFWIDFFWMVLRK